MSLGNPGQSPVVMRRAATRLDGRTVSDSCVSRMPTPIIARTAAIGSRSCG